MHIRHAREEDATAMAHVIVDAFLAAHEDQMPAEVMRRRREEWTYEVSANAWLRTLREIAGATDSHECIFVTCDDSDEVIGLVMGVPADGLTHTGEVSALYVRPDWQGRGVGRQLVRMAATWLHQKGFTALHIAVLAANTPARKFYEAIGGTVIGERAFEDYGYIMPETIYGWPDIRVLVQPK